MSLCKQCGSEGRKLGFFEESELDSQAAQRTYYRTRPRDLVSAVLMVAGFLAGYAAKRLAASTYRCAKCKHEWREWFQ